MISTGLLGVLRRCEHSIAPRQTPAHLSKHTLACLAFTSVNRSISQSLRQPPHPSTNQPPNPTHPPQTPTGLRFVLNTDNAMAADMRPHLRHIYAGAHEREWEGGDGVVACMHAMGVAPDYRGGGMTVACMVVKAHTHTLVKKYWRCHSALTHQPFPARHLGGARGEAPAVPDRAGAAAPAALCGEAGGLHRGHAGVPVTRNAMQCDAMHAVRRHLSLLEDEGVGPVGMQMIDDR